MTINPFTAELADEHIHDLQQVVGNRRRSSRPARVPARASALTLRIRPVRPGDAPLLADIFARLGPSSRYARFLAPKRKLSASELTYFTDVDHHDHEALIALTRLGGEPVGVVRFIRDADDPTSAEVAAEVVDEWQDRGVGSLLTSRLASRARDEGISQFTALMLAGNRRSARLLEKAGDVTPVTRDGGTVTYGVALPAPRRRARSVPQLAIVPVGRRAWHRTRRLSHALAVRASARPATSAHQLGDC